MFAEQEYLVMKANRYYIL